MAVHDYIPRNDAEFSDWMTNFIAGLTTHAPTFGLQIADITPISNAKTAFDSALSNQVAKQADARAAVEAKSAARSEAESLVRAIVREINNNRAMTNEIRVDLGLNPRDEERTSSSVGIDVPSLFLETKPGQVIVHSGTDASNELHNGKPDWARGCNIYRKKTGESGFTMIAFDTASPYVDTITGPAVDVTYKVAYRGTKETDIGPMSPEQTIAAGG